MKSIKVQNLETGMVLAKDVYSLSNNIIFKANTTLDDNNITEIRNSLINMVIIKDDNKNYKEDIDDVKKYYSEDYEKFIVVMREVIEEFKYYLNEIAFRGAKINIQKLSNIIERLLASTRDKLELLDNILNYHLDCDVVYKHSINVAVTGHMLAKWLNFSNDEIQIVGIGGLLHDIGKLKVRQNILNKSEKLTKSEFDEIRRHTNYGYNILNNRRDLEKIIALIALTHHERDDGSGYPMGFNYAQISKYAKVISIADAYDAMLSPRPYRQQLSIFETFEQFENQNHGQFDIRYLTVFSNRILEYYLDNYAVLSNGQIGKIITINKSNISRPILYTPSGILDLSNISDDLYIKIVFAGLTNDVMEAAENIKKGNSYDIKEYNGEVICQRCGSRVSYGRFCYRCVKEIAYNMEQLFKRDDINRLSNKLKLHNNISNKGKMHFLNRDR